MYITIEILHLVRAIKRIRAETPPESDPNDSPVKAYFQQQVAFANGTSRWEGRVYRSRSMLLGLPLIDINVSDPAVSTQSPSTPPPKKRARGWIAIGDRADGILLAIGAVAAGGVGLGAIAFGGSAIGWQACGGLAIA